MYDTSGQLVFEEVHNGGEEYTMVYTYDTYGNIRSAKKYTGVEMPTFFDASYATPIATETYSYTDSDWKDLLTAYNGTSITYDAAGNPLSYYNGQSYTFAWEDGNQLASAVTVGKTIDFEYNSDGIRTEKHTGTEDYYYRLSGTKVVEMRKESEYGIDRYVFVYDAEGRPHELHYYTSYDDTTPTKYFYVLNLQGDVIQLRDTSNAVVTNYTYDAWGKLISVTNASGATISDASHIANVNPIRYRGYFYDTETKLYYCNSRYYDPQVKRFINADVLLSTGTGFLGYNMFTYCNNNPVMYIDTNGTLHERTAGGGNNFVDRGPRYSWWELYGEPKVNGLKKFLGRIFGASSTTLVGVEHEVPVLPDPSPIVVEGYYSNYIVEQKGDSSKLFSVYHENKMGWHSVGPVINIFNFSLKISLGVKDTGVHISVQDGDETISFGPTIDFTELNIGVESTKTMERDNGVREIGSKIGANGGMLVAIYCILVGRACPIPAYQ